MITSSQLARLILNEYPDLDARLWPAEKLLIKRIVIKAETRWSTPFKEGDSNNGYPPVEDMRLRMIRGDLLRCIVTTKRIRERIPHYGIRIFGAQIVNLLDLSSANIPFPLIFSECYMPDGVDLRDARTQWLSFRGSHTGTITASRLIVQSSLVMNLEKGDTKEAGNNPHPRFWSKGMIRLHGATIMGVLDCRGAKFEGGNENQPAFMGEDLRVDSSAYFTGVEVIGGLSLRGAKIKDNLELAKHKEPSAFKSQGSVVLLAERIQVGGDVILGEQDHRTGEQHDLAADASEGGCAHKAKFAADNQTEPESYIIGKLTAKGSVNFSHAKIGGDFRCGCASVLCDGQIAFDMRDARIQGSVFFPRGFRTNGIVRLTGAYVGSCAYFAGTCFFGTHRTGLYAKNVKVNGTLAWTAISKGRLPYLLQLDLRYARVGQFQDDESSWPRQGNLLLDGFYYDSITTRLTERSSSEWVKSSARKWWWDVKTTFTATPPPPTLDLGIRRVEWLNRQIGSRFDARDLKYDELGRRIAEINIRKKARSSRRGGIGRVLINYLFHEDIESIKGNVSSSKSKKVSKIDEQKMLIGVNLLWNSSQFSEDRKRDLLAPVLTETAEPFAGLFRPQPYEQFARFLLEEGSKKESIRVLIAKEDARRIYERLPGRTRKERIVNGVWKAWRLLLKWLAGYGYRPEFVLAWGALIVLVGTLIFEHAHDEHYMVPAKEYVYATKDCIPPEYPTFHSLTYSLDVFLPIISLHQHDYWLPGETAASWSVCKSETESTASWLVSNSDKDPTNTTMGRGELWVAALHLWLWLEIGFGWLLTTIFGASLLGFLHTSELHEHAGDKH